MKPRNLPLRGFSVVQADLRVGPDRRFDLLAAVNGLFEHCAGEIEHAVDVVDR